MYIIVVVSTIISKLAQNATCTHNPNLYELGEVITSTQYDLAIPIATKLKKVNL